MKNIEQFDFGQNPGSIEIDPGVLRANEILGHWRHSRDPFTGMVSRNYKQEQASTLLAVLGKIGNTPSLSELVPDEFERAKLLRDAEWYDGHPSKDQQRAA